jgi:uncharacterized membrane protein
MPLPVVTSDARPRRARLSGRALPVPALRPLWVAFALSGIGAVGLAAASIFRHDRYGSNAYDLGLYDHTIWGYSRFHLLLDNTVGRTPNLVGNHFQPILFAFAPFEWLWADARVLLVVQAALLALAGVPIFVWAQRQLGLPAAALFEAAYLVFWGVLGGNLYDFHEVAVAAPAVSFALLALLERRTRLLLAMLALLLLTKENLALTVAAFGVYAAVVQRSWRLGAAVAAAGIGWLLIAIKVVIPAITGSAYIHWFYGALGSGPGGAAKHVLLHPLDTARTFFTPRAKRVSLFDLFAAWLFLPVVSPLVIVMLPTLAERFLSDRPEYWAQGFHYSIVIAPMLAFAAVDTVRRLQARLPNSPRGLATTIAALVLGAGLAFSFVRLKPLDELGRYTSAEHAQQIDRCLATVPPDASVSATSALVPHLSHRERIWVLDHRGIPQTDVYAIDVYTWMYPFTLRDVRALVDEKLTNGYGVTCTAPGTVVLRRGATSRPLAPQLRELLERA